MQPEVKRVLPVVDKLLPNRTKPVEYIAIHCSASPAKADWGAVDIDRMHKLRGFNCIGYHYVIRRDGSIEKGREDTKVGAHTQNFNSNSLGVCMIGGVEKESDAVRSASGLVLRLLPKDNFTPEQYASLKGLVLHLKAEHPKAIVQGHRDFPKVAKDCPSFDVKKWLSKEAI